MQKYMTNGNAYGNVVLKRFLLDEIVDAHIRPLLLDTFPFWRIKYGCEISLHVHIKSTYLDCVRNDIFDWISDYYNRATVASTRIDMFTYVERHAMTWTEMNSAFGQEDQIAARLTRDNPRIHFVVRSCVCPLPQ